MTSPPSPNSSPISSPTPGSAPAPKTGLHPRNRHLHGYDFAALAAARPDLAKHLITTPAGSASIDFSKPAAVKALNRALLESDYGIRGWDIPAQYLCPPIPGRADMVHYLADLLAEENDGLIPRGDRLWALDIGVGANGVYPLVGHAEYGWRFVGVDIDTEALDNVRKILAANPGLGKAIELRHQPVSDNIFVGVLRSGEKFDLSICNPPFHASPGEVAAAAQRKWRGLGKDGKDSNPSKLNFGGQSHELWYPGGERAFLDAMIQQSAGIPKRCLWFTSLVSKAENLRHVEAALAKLKPCATKVIPMAQGQKQSRLVAWTFVPKAERVKWRKSRWGDAGNAGSPKPE